MSSSITEFARTARPWALACATLLATAAPAAAQFGYGGYGGYGYGGYGYGGIGPGYGAVGYGGVGYGTLGYGGFGGGGYGGYGGVGGFGGGFGGYPLPGQINPYNLGYGNTLGLGLVPPAYVGTGTAGIGPVGIGGTNPLFGLGLSPLAVNNAAAEVALRRRPAANPTYYYPGYSGQPVRLQFQTNNTLPNSYNNQTIPNAATAVPR